MNTHFKGSTTSLEGTAVERTMKNTQGEETKEIRTQEKSGGTGEDMIQVKPTGKASPSYCLLYNVSSSRDTTVAHFLWCWGNDNKHV